jgi:hypothetical protein
MLIQPSGPIGVANLMTTALKVADITTRKIYECALNEPAAREWWRGRYSRTADRKAPA